MLAQALLCFPLLLVADEAPGRSVAALSPFDPRAVEVQFVDQSVLKMLLADEAIEIETPHGKLRVPTDEIRRIEFALRLPAEVQRRIDELLAALRSPMEDVHKPAARELLALGEQAYLAVGKAAKSGDPELAPRAGEVLARLREKLSKRERAVRDDDLIETADAKIAGRIASPSLKVHTVQFGELALRVADARSLVHQSLLRRAPTDEESENVLPDPGHLKAYESRLQESFAFQVTGVIGGGAVWGTDVYTTDSHLATAAVHAGVLKPGETGVVRLKILPSPPSFAGSERNGVVTRNYGLYGGAYEILKGADDE